MKHFPFFSRNHARNSALRILLLAFGWLEASLTIPLPPAIAQTRPAPAQSLATLEARLRKAKYLRQAAYEASNTKAVFLVQGEIERGTTAQLLVYGRTYPRNNISNNAIGLNNEERVLTIYRADPKAISSGLYAGECVALSQTEFTPAPADYYQVLALYEKYDNLVDSIENQIAALNNAKAQAIAKRQAAQKAQVERERKAKRDSTHLARVALADKETKELLGQLESGVALAGPSDVGVARLQSSARAVSLFNKWGNLGVGQRPLLDRAFGDLVAATTWQLERDDWVGAMKSAERMLSLEVVKAPNSDAQTGRERIQLVVDIPLMSQVQFAPNARPGTTAARVLRPGSESPAVAALAKVWLEKLPAYMAGPASREDKIRVAWLSQLLGSTVWTMEMGRSQTIATTVDAVRGVYGPGALPVLPEFEILVEDAKSIRVARQVERFQNSAPIAPISPPTLTQSQAPTEVSPATPNVSAPVGLPPVAPQAVVPQPLVPALDFQVRSFKTARKARLSDFAGKTVILYFWSLSDESRDSSPTPLETLYAFSKRYDPKQVIVLAVDEGTAFDYAVRELKKLTRPAAEAARAGGRGGRQYPDELYTLEMGMPVAAGDVPPERVVANQALTFYTGSQNTARNAMRVTIINAQQQVVGQLDFKEDMRATGFGDSVYDFSENALEDLMVKAMGPKP